jgi:hypothetical protein
MQAPFRGDKAMPATERPEPKVLIEKLAAEQQR